MVISRRERAVAILPLDKGMVLHTLHESRDLYDYHKQFDRIADVMPDAEMVKLATQLPERQERKFQPADLDDRYQARLREVIDAKLKGEGITPEQPAASRGDNAIDLMLALKRSLNQGKKDEEKSASAPPRRKAAALRSAPSEQKRAPGRKRA
jgi:DNA end-binding protein Ku